MSLAPIRECNPVLSYPIMKNSWGPPNTADIRVPRSATERGAGTPAVLRRRLVGMGEEGASRRESQSWWCAGVRLLAFALQWWLTGRRRHQALSGQGGTWPKKSSPTCFAHHIGLGSGFLSAQPSPSFPRTTELTKLGGLG
jgi:hypothetical protein